MLFVKLTCDVKYTSLIPALLHWTLVLKTCVWVKTTSLSLLHGKYEDFHFVQYIIETKDTYVQFDIICKCLQTVITAMTFSHTLANLLPRHPFVNKQIVKPYNFTPTVLWSNELEPANLTVLFFCWNYYLEAACHIYFANSSAVFWEVFWPIKKTLVKQQIFIIIVFQDAAGFLEFLVFVHHLCLQGLSLSPDVLLLLLHLLQPVTRWHHNVNKRRWGLTGTNIWTILHILGKKLKINSQSTSFGQCLKGWFQPTPIWQLSSNQYICLIKQN